MIYPSGSGDLPYHDYLRRAREERARLASRLLAGAAKGTWAGLVATGRAVARGARGAGTRWAAARRHRAAIAELRALDDRMLKDIGIERSQIRAVVAAGRPADRPKARRGLLRLVAGDRAATHITDRTTREAA